MSNLPNKIRLYLDREVDFRKDVIVQDDGQGQYIKEWNVSETKPTDAQLNALSSQATTLENNAKIDLKRRTEYLSWQDQMEMIYKDQKNGTTTFKDHCDKVRSDNPKE
tara:strand:- start:599 stop:922 length:324 start_codon:yes stop_codon:yes gene_type:complete